ncbi:uncharacterized protein LOC144604707 [Rhinoraja longicauda]
MNALFLATSFFVLGFLPAKESLPITSTKQVDNYSSKEAGSEPEQWEYSDESPHHQNPLQATRGDSRDPTAAQEPTPVTLGNVLSNGQNGGEVDSLRYKRFHTKPNSLDLTFHLLREFLGMARAEKMAQKAKMNRLIMQSVGK